MNAAPLDATSDATSHRVACPRPLILLAGALAAAIVGCATTRYEEYPPGASPSGKDSGKPVAETTVPVMEAGSVELQAMMALEERVARLEALVARRLDEGGGPEGDDLASQVHSLMEQLTALRQQLESMRQLRSSTGAKGPAGATSPTTSQSPAGPPSQDPGRVYEQALRSFHSGDYTAAQQEFQAAYDLAPTGELADNAAYWMGECAYARGAFTEAIERFRNVFQFSATEKDDDAQFKLGLCYLKLGQRENAMVEFRRLTVDHPGSEYVGRAEAHIREIRALVGGSGMEP